MYIYLVTKTYSQVIKHIIRKLDPENPFSI